MLVGGLVLGHAGALIIIGLAIASGGRTGVISALIGFALVVVFFSIGQVIELVALELASLGGLIITTASYLVRAFGLVLGLQLIMDATGDALSPGWLMAGVIATSLGWLTGVLLVAARQRVPIYDKEYTPPTADGDGK